MGRIDTGGLPGDRRVDRLHALLLRGAGALPRPGAGVSLLDEAPVGSGSRQLIRLPHHIHSPEFAEAAVAAFRDAIQQEPA